MGREEDINLLESQMDSLQDQLNNTEEQTVSYQNLYREFLSCESAYKMLTGNDYDTKSRGEDE